ncbi:ATP--guanido phosphotransferase [Clostridiaceae bacterium HFYG-1003]|nr:ATP--guanido phosphotransferase [Clostridiaceae bacterium HFYG-1003]
MTDKLKLKLSSRIRLARNLSQYQFPHRLDQKNARELVHLVEEAFYVSKPLAEGFRTRLLWEERGLDLLFWFEKHLVSSKLIDHADIGAFICNQTEDVSLMINEEDHIRLQTMSSRKGLKELYEEAEQLDTVLEEKLNWAFDNQLGYLTACPTNLGTALRASVMVHLPALTMQDRIGLIAQKLAQMGMTIRGIYGEGSQAEGNIYQISNEVTLGISEEFILKNIEETIDSILVMEAAEQTKLIESRGDETRDGIYRSIGVLSQARLMSSKEALERLSTVRLGIEAGIIHELTTAAVDEMIIRVQTGNLHRQLGLTELMPEKDRDLLRATILRNEMKRRLS